jgi:hypothetical protein
LIVSDGLGGLALEVGFACGSAGGFELLGRRAGDRLCAGAALGCRGFLAKGLELLGFGTQTADFWSGRFLGNEVTHV